MRLIDQYTMEEIGVPGIVLMERAALAVAETVIKYCSKNDKILIICGTGNNGADGIATARILKIKGFDVTISVVGNLDRGTPLFSQQLSIAQKLGISINSKLDLSEYTIIVDAIFGVGLNRPLDSDIITLISKINDAQKTVVSVDIPSGLSADTGRTMGAVINACITVTFGFIKMGLIMYPGCEFAGKVQVADIGFPYDAITIAGNSGYHYEKEDLKKLPKRILNSNKGTFGKVLVIAGSKDIYGACLLSAKAAYKTGAGLVKAVTDKCNREALCTNLPEALLYTYNSKELETHFFDELHTMINWANVVVIGPGISTSCVAHEILEYVISNANIPLIIDADAIQLLARKTTEHLQYDSLDKRIKYLSKILPADTILTPHLKELANLLHLPLEDIKGRVLEIADICTKENDLIYVMKDARTVVASGLNRYINVSGNNGMATGGSGDVLTGIIAGLIAQGLSPREASELGVYIHGLAGDKAREEYGEYAMLAGDIINQLHYILN